MKTKKMSFLKFRNTTTLFIAFNKPAKSIAISLLLCFVLLMNSCQKDPLIVETPVNDSIPTMDLTIYNKNYLLNLSSTLTNTLDNQVENKLLDLVVECSAANDTLFLLGYAIPIDSNRQTVFNHEESNTGFCFISNSTMQVLFSDNFNQIMVSYHNTSTFSGGSFGSQTTNTSTYQGNVSHLPPSYKPHTNAALLAGDYLLQLTESQVNSGTVLIDTVYTDTMSVNFDYDLNIDLRSFFVTAFHSFYQSEFSSDSGVINTTLFCQNDSLHLDYYTISQGGQDTLHSFFEGHKL